MPRKSFRKMNLLKSGTKLYSVVNLKCPRCNGGNLYLTQNAYDLKKFDKMHEKCAECGLRYDIEPGFFLGAMYISYISTVFIAGITTLSLYLILKLSFATIITIDIILLVVISPLVYRYARAIWINMFVKYKPEIKK